LQHLRAMVGGLAHLSNDGVSIGALHAKRGEFASHVIEDMKLLRDRCSP